MFITDSIHTIGKSHHICEDFTSHGIDPFPYIIVSDGCSGAKNTDIGAMLLVKAAEKVIKEDASNIFKSSDFLNESIDKEFTRLIYRQAETQARLMGLPDECLTATLLMAFPICNGNIKIIMTGDGCIFTTKRDSANQKRINLNYGDESPYYLRYALNTELDLIYTKNRGANNLSITRDTTGLAPWIERNITNRIVSFYIFLEDVESVILCTDGISSFVNGDNKEPVAFQNLCERFAVIRPKNENFLKRKTLKTLKKLAKKNIHNYDDLGIACMLWKKD